MSDDTKKRGVRGRRNIAMERDIGTAIHLARQRADLSQEDMASLMGFTLRQLQAFETADAIIPVSALAEAARVLQVPVSHFYGTHDPVQATGASAPPNLLDLPESQAMLHAFNAAPPSVQRTFSDLVTAMARR